MKLSEKLAQENWQQNQVWTTASSEGKMESCHINQRRSLQRTSGGNT
ncbi:hypothetical protein [Bacteroidetes bacterium endosymbiont of Geopemphigus sp.]|nr:hypothetical protein [Bacteroidetes bacterium endosymbiont of Geopemphigus sp.]